MEHENAVITKYIVQVVGPDFSQDILVQDAETTSVEIAGLRPFTSYTFTVSAVTNTGAELTATILSTTPEGGKKIIPLLHDKSV